MRRRVLAISILLILLVLTAGYGRWVLYSTEGAAWLVDVVAESADLRLDIGTLEGRLADELNLEDLTISWPDGRLTVQNIRLAWEPFSLLRGKLNVRSIEVEQPIIWDTESSTSTESEVVEVETGFSAADLAFLPGWLKVQIDHLYIQDFAYQDTEDKVVIADVISGNYSWSQRRIDASQFSYLSPYVHLTGRFEWQLQNSHLEMNADVHLPDELVSPQLFEDIVVPVDFPGEVVLEGDWNGFSGPIRLGGSSENTDTVWLAADAIGSWQGVRFDNLRGQYLNGKLDGNLDLAWIDLYRMHGQLTGTELDPGALVEDLEGKATLGVSGELIVPYDEEELQASLDWLIHKGHLRGHAVSGELSVDWADGDLSGLNLDLSSTDARVVARGKPSDRLELDLDVSDLKPFYPELSGQLLASGWLRWEDDYLTGDVLGSGKDIIWQEYSADNLDFQARHVSRQAPLELQLDMDDLRYAEIELNRLQVTLDGLLERHELRLEANGAAGDWNAELTGRYRDEIWSAKLHRLSGQSPTLGVWQLKETANLAWQNEGASLDHFSLGSDRGESLTLDVDEFMAAKSGQVKLIWSDLGHDRVSFLTQVASISGSSSGEIQLVLAGQKPVSLQARLTASAGFHDELADVMIPSLSADVAWSEEGLSLNVDAESDAGESLVVTARSSQPLRYQWPPDSLSLDMTWQKLKLERLSRVREELEVSGFSDGRFHLKILNRQILEADASISADGLMRQQGETVGIRSMLAELNWDEEGFLLTSRFEGVQESTLNLNLSSADSPHFYWPESGQIDLEIVDFDLQSIAFLLPYESSLHGVVQGRSSGHWVDGGEIFLEGQAGLSESDLTWQNHTGQVDVMVQDVNAEWQWQGDHLTGSVTFMLGDGGQLNGSWQLPLPARYPVNFNMDGDLQAELRGEMRVTGFLAALAPGLIQDLEGQLASELRVSGKWRTPVVSGQISLADAGAYVPAAGITLEDLQLRLVLQDEHVKIEDFSLKSGPGVMTGSGELNFDHWTLSDYRLSFSGDRFQVYNFPELQALCNPKFSVSGDLDELKLHGSVLIPEMTLQGTATVPESLPSNDVVIASAVDEDRNTLPVDIDLQVDIEIGDKVLIKTAGIETRLEGGGRVTLNENNQLATWGEISLVDGIYKAYGSNLEIIQGLLTYSGERISNPDLRIFAARDIGLVQAGVQITGHADAPVVTLHSRPAMPEKDIISYIFMGRPMRVDQEGEDALIIGTASLIPGSGTTLKDLGVTEIDVQGLFEGDGGVRLRKRLAERWELESTLGSESGVDLFYIFKFD